MSATIPMLHPPGSLTPAQESEVARVFELQKATALKLRRSTVAERLAKLRRLRAVIMANRDAIVEAGIQDFRRPATEIEMFELMPVIMDIADVSKKLKRWLKPKRVMPTSMMLGTSSWVRYEPRGRCLIVAPWNYPLTLTLGPLVPAIASGNTVIVKTSEVAPHFSAVLVKIIRETFAEDEVAVFEGDATLAAALLKLPFDHLFFTGAPSIGKLVMAAASKHLSSVTLELGGKCPVIVDDTADIEHAADTIAWAKYANSGQTCIAPDHVYVHASVQDRLVARFKKTLDRLYGENRAALQAPLGRVINVRHTQRIGALLEDAKQRGAKVLYGGAVDEAEHFVAPTLITGIPRDAKIMSEEIFGPLLPIIPFTQIDEVITSINDAPKPLALYIWSRNSDVADRIIENTSAGGTCINHQSMQFLHHNLPFGGVNNSGIGSYHGEWGIRAFSHERAIVRTRVFLAKVFFPPYTNFTRKIVNLILKYL
ncbi:MAG: aldehyde dehydrogenase [Hydrocarboniphaga sp.]|uniref:aldehyde dehydrogenase family protein n=1 Tax=Hydrocarboniphaga sp. TaxID=2033016 RepID=UPI0026343E64|nr:aldehyde dehydrogenase family protein [Hydrocarboniphaga sp.]MDB5969681.1 aldehyde dehydrogenase [Hydrocarboniphaga sp.]